MFGVVADTQEASTERQEGRVPDIARDKTIFVDLWSQFYLFAETLHDVDCPRTVIQLLVTEVSLGQGGSEKTRSEV